MTSQSCVVCGYRKIYLVTYKPPKKENFSLFKFVSSEDQRFDVWVENMNLKHDAIECSTMICSKHFTDDQFSRNSTARKKILEAKAIPTEHPRELLANGKRTLARAAVKKSDLKERSPSSTPPNSPTKSNSETDSPKKRSSLRKRNTQDKDELNVLPIPNTTNEEQENSESLKDYISLQKENQMLKDMISAFKEDAENIQKTMQGWSEQFKKLSDSQLTEVCPKEIVISMVCESEQELNPSEPKVTKIVIPRRKKHKRRHVQISSEPINVLHIQPLNQLPQPRAKLSSLTSRQKQMKIHEQNSLSITIADIHQKCKNRRNDSSISWQQHTNGIGRSQSSASHQMIDSTHSNEVFVRANANSVDLERTNDHDPLLCEDIETFLKPLVVLKPLGHEQKSSNPSLMQKDVSDDDDIEDITPAPPSIEIADDSD